MSHPPAGAVPVLIMVSAADPFQLAGVVFAASAALVALASLCHRRPPRHDDPRRPG
ncbi:hypothetical protein ACI7BZ_20120 [Xanthobacter sp. AM11]|uniref:hypothetical protein n=1 Tax=Xanthobacter sp. AM11 TaxID=3380643 RepID=UPI0039BED676